MLKRANTHHQQGFSLLEVLIALIVLTLGLLGVASLQGVSIRNAQSANHYTLATVYAYDAMDQLRSGLDPDAVEAMYTDADSAMKKRFPENFDFTVTALAGDEFEVVVTWDDNRVGDEDAAETQKNRVAIRSQI